MSKHLNQSNLYIISGVLTQEQVESAFTVFFNKLRETPPYSNDPEIKVATFEVNVVTNADGMLFGVTYAWVSSPKIYNIIVGLNPDGSERVREEPDPTWVRPTKKEKTGKFMWADDGDSDDEREGRGEYARPMRRIKLDPIATLPAVQYTAKQLEAVGSKLREEAASKGGDPDKVSVPTYGYFSVLRSFVNLPDSEEVDQSTICCRDAPSWVTEEMIRAQFAKFSTDTNVHIVKVDREVQKITYPKVRMRDNHYKVGQDGKYNKIVYVTFSNLSAHIADAAFALQMRTKTFVKQEGKKPVCLIFSFWKRVKPTHNPRAIMPEGSPWGRGDRKEGGRGGGDFRGRGRGGGDFRGRGNFRGRGGKK